MKWKISNPRSRLQFIGAIILLAGFAAALLIYVTARNDEDASLGLEDSKTYIYDLEKYGGKANVLIEELVRWFSGLWHGKSLAYTIACCSILISVGCFFVAGQLPADPESGRQDAKTSSGT